MKFTFTSKYKLDSVYVIYIIDNQEYIDILSSLDSLIWSAELDIATTNLLYTYLINGQYLVPNSSEESVIYEGTLYSCYGQLRKSISPPHIIEAVLCKNFSSDVSSPIEVASSFSSVDKFICLWCKLDSIYGKEIITIQLLNPSKEVHIIEYDVLEKKTTSDQIFYLALPINPTLKTGEWTLIINHQSTIIYQKSFYFKNLQQNSYSNKYTQNANLRIDIKG